MLPKLNGHAAAPATGSQETLRYDRALAAAGIGIWEVDLATSTVVWDDRCCALFGLPTGSALPYAEAIRYIHDADRSRVDAAVQDALAGKDGGHYEQSYRTLGPDGTLRHVRFTGQAELDVAGKAVHFSGVAQNVTSEKTAAAELAYRTALLEAQNEAIPDAILIVDTKGGMISFNRHFAEVWGIPEDIIARKDDAAALAFAMTQLVDPQGFIEQVNYCYAHPNDAHDHVEILFKDGRTIERWGNPVRGTDGTRYGWAWYFRDITAQKADARELRRKESAIAATSNGICITGSTKPDSPIVYVNPAFEEMTGYRADEIVGQDCRFLQGSDRDQPGIAVLREAIRTGTAATVVLRNYRKNGTLFYNELTISPVVEEGVVKHFVGIQTDITERRATEEALRQSEQRFRSVFNGQFLFLALLSPDGVVMDINELPLQAAGAAREDVLGKKFWDTAWWKDLPEMRQNWPARLEVAAASEGPVFSEDHFQTGSGEVRIADAAVTAVRGTDGAVEFFIVQASDITERKRVEQTVRESEARFRGIIEQAPIATCVFEGPDFRITLANEPMIRTMGKGRSVEGKPLIEALPELAGQGFLEILTSVYTTGETFEARATPARLMVDGVEETQYFDITFKALRDASGEVYGILDMSADVTGQVVARQKIEESEAYFRQLTDTVPAIIWITRPDGYCEYLNRHWYELTGQTAEEAAGLGWLDATHPDDKARTGEIFLDANARRVPFHVLYRLRTADGTYRWAVDSGQPKFSPDGTYEGMIGTVVDVHEQQEAQAAERRSSEELEFAINATELGTWEMDPVTFRFTSNARIKEWFGLPADAEEIPLQVAMDAMDEAGRAQLEAAVAYALNPASGGRYDVEYSIHNPQTGTPRVVRAKGKVTFTENGKPDRFSGTLQDITAEVAAREALRESEATMSAVLDALPVGVVVADAAGRIIRDNAANRALWGMPPHTDSWKEYGAWVGYWPETGERITAGEWALARALLTGEVVRNELVEFEPFDRPGQRGAFLNNAAPVRDAAGRVIGGVIAEQDVTDRLRMERDLRESEGRFRALANDTPAFMFSADADANVEFANRAWLRFVGLDDETGAGQAWAGITHPDDVGPMMEVYSRAVKDLKPYQFEIRQKGTDGAWHWILWSGIPRTDASGAFTGITGVGFDVTAQKTAQQAVEASEQKFRSVVEGAPAAMGLFMGRDLIIESPNQTFIDIVGKGWGVVGKPLREAMPELVTEGQPFLKILDDVFTTGVPFVSPGSQVKILRDGVMTDNYYNITYTPLSDADGKVYAILDIAIDVTEQVAAQKALEESNLFNRNVVAFSPVAKAVYRGPDLEIEMVNEKMLALMGRDESIVGMKYFDALPELRGTPIEERLRRVYETGETFHTPEERVEHIRHGEAYVGYYSFTFKALRNTEGAVYGIIDTAVELTESVAARKELEEQKTFLQNALDIGNLGTFHVNPESGTTQYTDNIREWYGLDALNEPLDRVLRNAYPDDVQMVGEVIARSIADPAHAQHDFVFRTTDAAGAVHHLRSIGKATYDDAGQCVSISGLIQNVTAQVTAQRKIEEAQRQILQSFEQSPVAIALIDEEDLTFRMVNPFYAQLVGRAVEDLVDKPLLKALPELAGQGFDDLLHGVISTGTAYISHETSVQLERGRGLETIYVDLHYQPRRTESGRVTGVLVIATDITASVEARRAVEESESRLRSVIESAPFPIGIYVGEELRIQFANQTIIEIFGKGPNIVGRRYTDVLPELEGSGIFEQLRGVLKTGTAFHATGQRVDLIVDGAPRTFYFNYHFTPVLDADGRVYAVMNTAADVTDVFLAKQQVEESEARLRAVLQDTPVAAVMYGGRDLRIEHINAAMLRILGRDASIAGMPLEEAIPELKGQPFIALMQRVYDTGESYTADEQPATLKDGDSLRTGYFTFSYTAMRSRAGENNGVLVLAIEVTEQVETRRRIEEAEASLRSAVELAELGTWELDVATGRVHYSDRLREWFGFDRGKTDLDEVYDPIHPDDRERVMAAIGRALQPGGGGDLYDEEYRIVQQGTDRIRIVHAQGKTSYDGAGNPLRFSGTAQDVTKERALQAELERQVQERTAELAAAARNLTRSNEELSQYAYVASHDLQEPLRKIQMFSGILNSQSELPETARGTVARISGAAERMSTLIQSLLEFSRLQKNDETLMRPVDLSVVVNDVATDFELMIAERGASVNVGELPVVEGVGLQMNQLFYNLVGNALKFVRPDAVPDVRIASRVITAAEADGRLDGPPTAARYHHITVSDNGIGFEVRYTEQIFEVFKRLHGRDAYPGSGIGLALCRRIVANHGGALWAESELGQGSTFNILLPDAGPL